MRKINMHLIAGVAVTTSLFAGVAGAEVDNRDVVRDTNHHIVKNTFDNCVRTKWISNHDECANKVAEGKPIKRSRSYLVFFDFDKSNITEGALDIINRANAEAAKSSHHVTFSITGHADRSGPDAYNIKLSQRRANAVKNKLIQLGVNGEEVHTDAKGEREPLVPTADGIREPQNRRAEIIYSVGE